MSPSDNQIDVIVPTASAIRWPANESIPWNRARTRGLDVRFIPIESSGPAFSFARSVNAGFDLARPEADVFLLNDDCFMDAGWVEALLMAKRAHPTRGIFGALLRFPKEKDVHGDAFSGRAALNHWRPTYQHAGGYIPLDFWDRLYGLVRFALWNASPFWVIRQVIATRELQFQFPGHFHRLSRRHRIDLVTGAAMLITRETMDRIGRFDERFRMGFEDIDYCLRAVEADIGLCLVSNCLGMHYESLTSRHLESVKRESYDAFRKKWRRPSLLRVVLGHGGAAVHPAYCACPKLLPTKPAPIVPIDIDATVDS